MAGLRYELEILQQPDRCRVSGISDRDRRPIDPPPILRVNVTDERSGAMVDNPDNYPDLLLATALEQLSHDGPSSEDADGPESVTESGRHPQEGPIPTTTGSSDSDHVDASNNLVGTMFSNCHRMNGLDGAMGLFFAFADLSVRAEGRYRLRFELYDLSRADSDDDEPHRLAVVVSNAFSAVGPKKFAGMTEATELSKHLAQQGIKLPVRGETKKGSGRRGGGGGAGVGDADD